MENIFDRNLVGIVLEQMRECVRSDRFVVKQTGKNKAFIAEYGLSRKMQQDLLLCIKVGDYFNSSESRNFPDKYVHEFCPTFELLTCEGTPEEVSTYVKFEIERDRAENYTVVISLHTAERMVCYPFSDEGV